ncbi:ATP-binding protein [Halolamina sp. C58]|uniref:ATP-binding protein n=1 Tax=Halolamina sp. C58 TaxID=3421640 RepID=UPI003EBDEC7E
MTRRLVASMSGWGKSYHSQGIIEASIPEFDYVAVLDYKDEYRGLVKAGFASHFIVGGQELSWSVGTWRQFFEENGAVVLARHKLTTDEWKKVAARVTSALRELAPESRGSLVAIDEAHWVAPQSGSVPEAIEGLSTTGRGEGASSLWITQRLAKLEEDVVSQCDEQLAGGFESKNDRNKLDPEYPEDLHNPQAEKLPKLAEELQTDDGQNIPLRKFEDDDGSTIGSEWVYADNSGERERRDTRTMSMESTHYGDEGNPLHDPEY